MWLYYRIKNFFVYGFDDLRGRWQRFMRGWSYGDVWDMDFWFMRNVKPMLIHLRDHGIGVPNDLYLEGAENEREAWEAVLTEMIYCLDMMDEDNVRESLGFDDRSSYKRMTHEDYKRVGEIMDSNKDRFFELFSKHFYSLWD